MRVPTVAPLVGPNFSSAIVVGSATLHGGEMAELTFGPTTAAQHGAEKAELEFGPTGWRASGWTRSLSVLCVLFVSAVGVGSLHAQDREPNRGGVVDLASRDPLVALERLKPAPGYEVNLFASEEQFPDLAKPLAMTFDAQGRLWVLTSPTYPHVLPGETPGDKLVILDDTNEDGRADKLTVFADGLYQPMGFELGDGGVYVSQQPNLVFLRDSDNDDRADERHVVLHGFGTEDSHHATHAFTWGPGGGLYFQEGTFLHSQVETPHGPVRVNYAAVFRYEPKTERLGVFVSYPFANPWGHVVDRWGQNFISDASNGNNHYGTAFSGHVDYPRKQRPMKVWTTTQVRPTAGIEFIRSRHFPDEAQGNFLINNVIGFHGTKQYKVAEDGSGFVGTEVEPLLQSTDTNFRPVAMQFGPDGALYVVDWFNPLIGHMQFSLRDPRRDKAHGRVWRVTAKGRPLLERPRIHRQPIAAQLELLKAYEDRTRYWARRALREQPTDAVVRELRTWIAALDPADPEHEHHLLEALWVYQHHDIVEQELLKQLLQAKEFRARAAAVRVLQLWFDRVDGAMPLLHRMANDPAARVRLEAVRALSFVPTIEATEAALGLLAHPLDYYLDYALDSTITTLDKAWKPALEAGHPVATDNPAGLAYLLARLEPAELTALPRSEPVYHELLRRPGIERTHRQDALASLARSSGRSPLAELLAAIARIDGAADGIETSGDLVQILIDADADSLAGARADLERLALGANHDVVRQGGWIAQMRADGVERAWQLASQSSRAQVDLLDGTALITDQVLREALYPRVRSILTAAGNASRVENAPPSAAPASDEVTDLRDAAMRALPRFPGHEHEVVALLAAAVRESASRSAAVEALRRIPIERWPADVFGPLAASLVAYARDVPSAGKTSAEFRSAVALGREVATRLPESEGARIGRELDSLSVRTIEIQAVLAQMKFDIEQFSVAPGEEIEIVFVNPDHMPHNLLVTAQGALEDVSLKAEAMASTPDGFQKHFVPESPSVLHATKLINHGETARLRFSAPKEPGGYPYVCTFPGHWRTMNGTMNVRTPPVTESR